MSPTTTNPNTGRCVSFRLRLIVMAAAISVSAAAQPAFHIRVNNAGCDFQVRPDELKCDTDSDRGIPSICTVTFQNKGTDACVGHFAAYVGPATLGTVDH